MNITTVFVYGTLKRYQVRGGMWPRTPLAVRAATSCAGFAMSWRSESQVSLESWSLMDTIA